MPNHMRFGSALPAMVLGVACLASPAPSVAGLDDPPSWNDTCVLNGKTFELHFKSRTGDFGEDDMDVRFKTTTGKSVALALPLGWYSPRSSVSNVRNLCRDFDGPGPSTGTAFAVSDNAVLVFLSADRRPSLQHLVLALVDVSSGRVLDLMDTRMAIKASGTGERFTVRRAEGGWQVRLATEVLQGTGDDSIEIFIENWVTVKVIDGKIRVTQPAR